MRTHVHAPCGSSGSRPAERPSTTERHTRGAQIPVHSRAPCTPPKPLHRVGLQVDERPLPAEGALAELLHPATQPIVEDPRVGLARAQNPATDKRGISWDDEGWGAPGTVYYPDPTIPTMADLAAAMPGSELLLPPEAMERFLFAGPLEPGSDAPATTYGAVPVRGSTGPGIRRAPGDDL